MKRLLSVLLATLMVLSCTVIVSAQNDFTTVLGIVTQPTVIYPTVTVSAPDSVESYQWQMLGEAVESEITPDHAIIGSCQDYLNLSGEPPAYLTVESEIESATYDSENGWSPAVLKITQNASPLVYALASNTYYIVEYFSAYFEANSTIVVEAPATELFMLSLINRKGLDGVGIQLTLDEETGDYSAIIPESGYYVLAGMTHALAPESLDIKAYCDSVNEFVDVEGETENALSDIELGKVYRCKITAKDGNAIYSDIFEAYYQIVSQPTAADPTVTVSFEKDAKFQWYKVNEFLVTIDNTMVEEAYGTYDSETKEWTGDCGEPSSYEGYDYLEYSIDLFTIELKKGQTIKITISNTNAISPEDPEFRFYNLTTENNNYIAFDENGILYFTPEEDGLYDLYQYATYPEEATFKIETVDFEYKKIDSETEKTLSAFELNQLYCVTATYPDDTVLASDIFKMVPAITKQPTTEDPSIEVNFEFEDTTFKWYELQCGKFEVTDKIASSAYLEGDSEGDPSYYDDENGYWIPSLYGIFTRDSKQFIDGRIYFENTDSWETVNVFFWSDEKSDYTTWPGEAMVYDEYNGVYYYDIPDGVEYVIFNNGSTQTADQTLSSENNLYNYAEDEWSYFEEEYQTEYYEYDIFEIHLNAGESVTITASADVIADSYDFFIKDDDDSDLGDYIIEQDGRVLKFTAAIEKDYYFYVDTYEKDITFTAEIEGKLLGEAIENATTKEFEPTKAGEYLCIVTYADGTKLISDSFIVTEDDLCTLGDINDDGDIDQYDYILAKRIHFNNYTPTEKQLRSGDVNKDGKNNQYDYILIKRHHFKNYVIK